MRPAPPKKPKAPEEPVTEAAVGDLELRVRRMHRRDINRVWEFLKLVFRDVNRETVEYQRPRHKKHFLEIYEEDGIEQLVFEIKRGAKFELAGYAEYAYEIVGSDSWMNYRYFENVTHGHVDALIDDLRAGKKTGDIPTHGTLARVRQSIPVDRRASRDTF